MLRYLSAGESHGPSLTAIVEGMPAGIEVDIDLINDMLKRRQGGYGRGKRMAIESDKVEISSGIRNGVTLGSPITLTIHNKDWENWKEIMYPYQGAKVLERIVTKPRPGHADLPGAIKYEHRDMRNILERASARETAIRTAVGGLAQSLLKKYFIWSAAHVVRIGGIEIKEVDYEKLKLMGTEIYNTPVYCSDPRASQDMIKEIDKARSKGDSVGGIFEIVVGNLPVGLGSHVHWDRRLDGKIAGALMSIQGIKGVEIGLGFQAAGLPGSKVHDEIYYNEERGFYRKTNNAGGIEGGMTNGELLRVRAAMKPIPTLYTPLHSVDFITKEPFEASVERSDTCAVPAAAVVGDAVVAWEIARVLLEDYKGTL
ncbi:chorismate synthase [Desulfitibacter alkalitolerans]|uniref:chorismate synthase n=1 Tax=Desulfitibacter alkalitolerans TaxID=264641 RepID=UPI0006848EB7|nr:chorismate synthase [Desulfitibacter alkalitolerans]